MANDRVFIKCDGCGSWTMLMKHYPGSLSVWNNEKLIEWIDSHGLCHKNLYAGDLGGLPGFSLMTESSPESDRLDPALQNKLAGEVQ